MNALEKFNNQHISSNQPGAVIQYTYKSTEDFLYSHSTVYVVMENSKTFFVQNIFLRSC